MITGSGNKYITLLMRFLWCICVVCFFQALSFSQETSKNLKEKFLKEAPMMWNEYLRHFTKIEGNYVETISYSDNRNPQTITNHFICDYPNVLFESESDDFSYHYCSNNTYAFSLTFNENEPSVLNECQRLSKEDLPEIQDWTFPANLRTVRRNFSVNFITELVAQGLLLYHKWLPTLINCPDFVIDEIEEISQDNEQLVRIKFSNNPKVINDQAYLMNVRHGEIFLYPNHYWLIKSGHCFFWSDDDSYTTEWTNHYDFEKFTAPQLISRELETIHIQNKSKIFHRINYEFRPLSKEDTNHFTLSYYGLPEPDFGEKRVNRLRHILMITGLGLIGLGIWRIYRRKQETSGV